MEAKTPAFAARVCVSPFVAKGSTGFFSEVCLPAVVTAAASASAVIAVSCLAATVADALLVGPILAALATLPTTPALIFSGAHATVVAPIGPIAHLPGALAVIAVAAAIIIAIPAIVATIAIITIAVVVIAVVVAVARLRVSVAALLGLCRNRTHGKGERCSCCEK